MEALLRVVEAAGLKALFHVYLPKAVKLGRQLGVGGCACVFQGTLQLSSDVGSRQVAIKVLHPGNQEKELASFFQEARAALTVAGVHVCQPLGATVCDGRPAFILPLYQDNVHDLVDDEYPGGVPVWQALAVLRSVARGLFDMHTKGIVHLDLKPLNILVNGNFNEVVIADFGLSTTYASTLSRTKANMGTARNGGGTVPYMSPEQFDAEAFGRPGPKSDVWALGCVAIQLFTNRWPHYGKTDRQVMFDLAVKGNPPPIPTSLPPDVAQFLKALLQIDPKDRLTSAEAMERAEQLVAAHPQPSQVRRKPQGRL